MGIRIGSAVAVDVLRLLHSCLALCLALAFPFWEALAGGNTYRCSTRFGRGELRRCRRRGCWRGRAAAIVTATIRGLDGPSAPTHTARRRASSPPSSVSSHRSRERPA